MSSDKIGYALFVIVLLAMTQSRLIVDLDVVKGIYIFGILVSVLMIFSPIVKKITDNANNWFLNFKKLGN